MRMYWSTYSMQLFRRSSWWRRKNQTRCFICKNSKWINHIPFLEWRYICSCSRTQQLCGKTPKPPLPPLFRRFVTQVIRTVWLVSSFFLSETRVEIHTHTHIQNAGIKATVVCLLENRVKISGTLVISW